MTADERITALEARLATLEARIAVLERSPFGWQPPVAAADTSYADRCPCNPKNGGSGVCGCVLGGTQVTCSASAIGAVNEQIRFGLQHLEKTCKAGARA